VSLYTEKGLCMQAFFVLTTHSVPNLSGRATCHDLQLLAPFGVKQSVRIADNQPKVRLCFT
jgi:hypothetical protein